MTDDTPNPTMREPQAAPSPGSPPAPDRPATSPDVRARRPEYRGEELDPERGPGLGCFWFQVIVLGFFFVLIPIGLNLNWPFELLAILLFVVIGLLLLTGQTVIFLLRLVAADRRAQGRRRPLASSTRTVGEIEDEQRVAHAVGGARPAAADRVASDAAAAPDAGELAADADAQRADGVSVASQAMIGDEGVFGAPVEGAHDTESEAGPVAGPDATDTDEVRRAPAPTTEDDAAVLVGLAGGEEQMAARMHESSPDGQGLVPAAADDVAPGTAAVPEAPPEEPDPGVRQ